MECGIQEIGVKNVKLKFTRMDIPAGAVTNVFRIEGKFENRLNIFSNNIIAFC